MRNEYFSFSDPLDCYVEYESLGMSPSQYIAFHYDLAFLSDKELMERLALFVVKENSLKSLVRDDMRYFSDEEWIAFDEKVNFSDEIAIKCRKFDSAYWNMLIKSRGTPKSETSLFSVTAQLDDIAQSVAMFDEGVKERDRDKIKKATDKLASSSTENACGRNYDEAKKIISQAPLLSEKDIKLYDLRLFVGAMKEFENERTRNK